MCWWGLKQSPETIKLKINRPHYKKKKTPSDFPVHYKLLLFIIFLEIPLQKKVESYSLEAVTQSYTKETLHMFQSPLRHTGNSKWMGNLFIMIHVLEKKILCIHYCSLDIKFWWILWVIVSQCISIVLYTNVGIIKHSNIQRIFPKYMKMCTLEDEWNC